MIENEEGSIPGAATQCRVRGANACLIEFAASMNSILAKDSMTEKDRSTSDHRLAGAMSSFLECWPGQIPFGWQDALVGGDLDNDSSIRLRPKEPGVEMSAIFESRIRTVRLSNEEGYRAILPSGDCIEFHLENDPPRVFVVGDENRFYVTEAGGHPDFVRISAFRTATGAPVWSTTLCTGYSRAQNIGSANWHEVFVVDNAPDDEINVFGASWAGYYINVLDRNTGALEACATYVINEKLEGDIPGSDE